MRWKEIWRLTVMIKGRTPMQPGQTTSKTSLGQQVQCHVSEYSSALKLIYFHLIKVLTPNKIAKWRQQCCLSVLSFGYLFLWWSFLYWKTKFSLLLSLLQLTMYELSTELNLSDTLLHLIITLRLWHEIHRQGRYWMSQSKKGAQPRTPGKSMEL